MRRASVTPLSLERCALAAGYGAVSSLEDDAPVRRGARERHAGRSVWRAALALVLILA